MTMNIESHLEDDWESFLVGGESKLNEDTCDNRDIMGVVPKSTSLYISTKTKILFMNSRNIFNQSIRTIMAVKFSA